MNEFRSRLRALRPFAIGAGLSLMVAMGAAFVRHAAAPAGAPRFVTPLGNRLPEITLQTLDGTPISLRARLGGRPALIYVFGVSECSSCSNLPLEFKIAHNEAPGLQTILIGSGSSADAFQASVKQMGLESSTVVDEHRALLTAVGLAVEPLVLLADSTGQILLVDTRGASRAAQFPMGNILHGIGGILNTVHSTTVQSLHPVP